MDVRRFCPPKTAGWSPCKNPTTCHLIPHLPQFSDIADSTTVFNKTPERIRKAKTVQCTAQTPQATASCPLENSNLSPHEERNPMDNRNKNFTPDTPCHNISLFPE